MPASQTNTAANRRRLARTSLAVMALAFTTVVGACSSTTEHPVAQAKPGDTLVISGDRRVVLERPFRPGMPNGLYGGVVRVSKPGQPERRLVVNGICSMPQLQAEGWPGYDNLYGRRLPSEDRWQVLFHFDGRIDADHTAQDLAWLTRLRDNICRRGSFSDRRQTSRQN
ncbi:MAG: hypothetical protein ACKN89_11810 [Cyanobium sp.]|jgi:hypothetical protein